MLRSIVKKLGEFQQNRRRFPKRVSDVEAFNRLIDEGVIDCFEPAAPFITRDTPLVTMGSCFADNIARFLSKSGYDVHSFVILDRLFTPFALRSFTERVLRDRAPAEELLAKWNLTPDQVSGVQAALLKKDATVIITHGLSIVWFDRATDEMVIDPTVKVGTTIFRPRFDLYEMRQTSVEENFEAMCETINALRAVNPFVKIVMTLSPIPIIYSASDYPVVAADCISKSTLRIALDQVMRLGLKDVYYYPSFEMLRWAAPMLANVWFDGTLLSHVRIDWIAFAVGKFRQYYCVEDSGRSPTPPPLENLNPPA